MMSLWGAEMVYEGQMLLTAENIDALSGKFQEILKETGISKELQTKAWLSSDALLVNWLETYQPVAPLLKVTITKQWGRYHLRYALAGEMHDPLQDSNEFGIPVAYKELFTSYQSEWAIAPAYSYANGENVIKIALPRKKVPTIVKTLLALVAAVATYFLCQVLPMEVGGFLSKSLFKPVLALLLGVLKSLAAIMIFTSMVTGICNLGDASALSKQGQKIALHVQKCNFLWTACAFILCTLFYGFSLDGEVSYTSILAKIIAIFVSSVPVNIFASFLKADMLQILFAAAVVGAFLVSAKEETKAIYQVISELNFVVLKFLTGICSLMPYIVYLSFSQLLLNGYVSSLSSVGYLIVLTYGIVLFLFGARLFYVCRYLKLSLLEVCKQIANPFSLAYMTASSLATLPQAKEILMEKYHVKSAITNFSLPVMIITGKYAAGVHTTVLVFCMAEAFGVSISLPMILSGYVLISLMCSAVPPVSGGIFINFAVIFAFFGLPGDALAVPIAVDVIFDMLRSAINITGTIVETIYLDRVLQKEEGA